MIAKMLWTEIESCFLSETPDLQGFHKMVLSLSCLREEVCLVEGKLKEEFDDRWKRVVDLVSKLVGDAIGGVTEIVGSFRQEINSAHEGSHHLLASSLPDPICMVYKQWRTTLEILSEPSVVVLFPSLCREDMTDALKSLDSYLPNLIEALLSYGTRFLAELKTEEVRVADVVFANENLQGLRELISYMDAFFGALKEWPEIVSNRARIFYDEFCALKQAFMVWV